MSDAKNGDLTFPQVSGESNIGLVRKENEDSFCFQTAKDRGLLLTVVADGVGGHSEGAMASNLICQYIASNWLNFANCENAEAVYSENILRAINSANDAIYARNKYKNFSAPSGTTLVAAIINGHKVDLWHVGDSRFYRLRNGVLEQITRDHTVVRKLEDAGVDITPEIKKQYGHIISRAVGPGATLEVEFDSFERVAGDRYLLCSDGLSNMLSPNEIKTIIGDAKSARECSSKLMRSALLAGGTDNITALVVFTD